MAEADQEGGDGEVVVGYGPVEGEAVVIVFLGGELGVGLYLHLSFRVWWKTTILGLGGGGERRLHSAVIRQRWL